MNTETRSLLGEGLRRWIDAPCVRCELVSKSLAAVNRDHLQSEAAYRERLAPDPMATNFAAREGAMTTSYAQVLQRRSANGPSAADLDSTVDPAQDRNPQGRILLSRWMPEGHGEREFSANAGAPPEGLTLPHDFPIKRLRP